MNKSDLYDKDFFCWTVENATLLREGKADQADLEHIAQEIEDMGKRDYREVSSMLRVLISHLLKWRFQPELRSKIWRDTINALRLELEAIFEDSASLRNKAREDLARIYRKAVRQARNETELPTSAFPAECPFVLDQVLDDQFFPEPRHR